MDKLIEQILKDLDDNIEYWRKSDKDCKHFYVDAYLCVKHNILERLK